MTAVMPRVTPPPTLEDLESFRRVAEFYLDVRPDWAGWLEPAITAMTAEATVLHAYGLGCGGPGWEGEVRTLTTSARGRVYEVEMDDASPFRARDKVRVIPVPE